MRSILLMALTFSFLISCDETKTRKEEVAVQGKTIEYYPKANIYYDVDRQTFILFSREKAVWESVRSLSPQVQASLGKKIILTDVEVPVYRNNAQHRLIYSVSLYNSPDNYRKKFVEDSLAMAPKILTKKVADTLPEKKKKRRGLGKLLEKIF